MLKKKSPKKAIISSQNVSVSRGMKTRLLDLNNDFWLRLIFIPFAGLCIPYIADVVTPESSNSFLKSHPSIYFACVVIIIFELNRLFIKLFRNRIKSQNNDFLFLLIKRIVLQLVLSAFMIFIFLLIWYHFILKSQDYTFLILKN